jgi:hypothetical protein
MKYEPVKKHDKHPIVMKKGDFGPHKVKVTCQLCNEFIKWGTVQEYKTYKEIENGKTNQL